MSSNTDAVKRKLDQKRKLNADQAGVTNSGRKQRNTREQEVHDEQAGALNAHDENTDRDTDSLYDTETDNEVTEWRRHSDLDAPPARPGYVNRFIRIRLGTGRDLANFNKSYREGWRPIKASSVSDNSLPTVNYGKFGDVIGVEDMILCEMTVKVHKQRQQYYRSKLGRQTVAVERQLKAVSRGDVAGFGEISHVNRSRVSGAVTRKARVADDD